MSNGLNGQSQPELRSGVISRRRAATSILEKRYWGPLVVFVTGMRINPIHKIGKWLPVALAMGLRHGIGDMPRDWLARRSAFPNVSGDGGLKGAERPAAIRCGCFLPDLTRFANANVHPTPGDAYGDKAPIRQV